MTILDQELRVGVENVNTSSDLPKLAKGFFLSLYGDECKYAAFFPYNHFMWVSSNRQRVSAFLKSAARGEKYDEFLTANMITSFSKYFSEPVVEETNPFPQGQILDSTICFLPTNDCGLGCKYCFSGAEPKKFGSIPWTIAKAGIDLGLRNAVLQRLTGGKGVLEVRFFGGGEPTEYWRSFTRIVEYARESAAKAGVGVHIETMTNGFLELEKAVWFSEHIDGVTISIDGPPDIQDTQRPTHDGEPTFSQSWQFIQKLEELGVNIKALRVTVTGATVMRMTEIATFFWDNLEIQYPVQFEPVYLSEVGRQDTQMPDPRDFIAEFRRVELLGRARGAEVGTATRPLVLRKGAYCDSLEGKGVFITPNGYLSLCSEISRIDDPRKDDYFVGSFDRSLNRFKINESELNKETSIVRNELPLLCNGCFAQASCKGGCEPRSKNEEVQVKKTWCHLVRGNLRWMWSDVCEGLIPSRAKITAPEDVGEELFWLPIYDSTISME